MTWKFTCPGCQTATTDNSREATESGKCPNCGLSMDVVREIWRVREGHATDEVKARFEELAVRAGKAEAELRIVKHRLERVQEAANGGYDYEL